MLRALILVCASVSPLVYGHGIPIIVSPGLNYTNPSSPPVNCNNISTGINSTCYATLNETKYLTDWNTTYRPETCSPQQLWSTCYLNFAYANATGATYTKDNITAHDCSTLSGNSSTNGCPPPPSDTTAWTAREYYAILTIYNLQHHIFVWSQAISFPASRIGINAIAAGARIMSPNSLLQSIIREHGINQAADDALVELLDKPSIRPTPQVVSGVSGGPQNSLDAAEAVPAMVERLAEVLRRVMADFDAFLGTVSNGAYSGNDLALVGELTTGLRGAP